MSEELKSCPFCGGNARYEYDDDDQDYAHDRWVMAQCQYCGANSGYFLQKEQAANIWNSRVTKEANHD